MEGKRKPKAEAEAEAVTVAAAVAGAGPGPTADDPSPRAKVKVGRGVVAAAPAVPAVLTSLCVPFGKLFLLTKIWKRVLGIVLGTLLRIAVEEAVRCTPLPLGQVLDTWTKSEERGKRIKAVAVV